MTFFDYDPFSWWTEYDPYFYRPQRQTHRAGVSQGTTGSHRIRCDYLENKEDNTYVLLFDMPGIEKKDINISIDANNVTVQAMVEPLSDLPKWKASHKFHACERLIGNFKRTVSVGLDLDEKNVKATMENGVLQVVIGRKKEPVASGKQILIS